MNLHEMIGKMREDSEENLETANEVPEITPELIAGLSNELPELRDVDQDQLRMGLEAEASEHFDSVGGDMTTIAKIALDHLTEFPGQKYYTALEQLETELSKAEEQGATTEEPATEEPVAEPAAEEEVVTEEPEEEFAVESKVKKEKKETKKS